MRARIARNVSLILLAASVTSPAQARQSPPQKPAPAHIQKSSDMTLTVEDADPAPPLTVMVGPPLTPPPRGRPKAFPPLFQVSGTGKLAPSFDAQSLARHWVAGPHEPGAITLDLTVDRHGKIATCNDEKVSEPAHSKRICKELIGQSLYRWSKGAPFPQERAATRLRMERVAKPPYAERLQVTKAKQGIPVSVDLGDGLSPRYCFVRIEGAPDDYIFGPDERRICAFAKAEAKKRGLRLPQAGDAKPEKGKIRNTTLEFSLKAAPDYIVGKLRPAIIMWSEAPSKFHGKTPYVVPPLSADDHKMPPLGRLIIPDLESDAERTRLRTFDPRGVNQNRLWDSRARVRIRLDGSIASCEPLVSHGAMWFDQYLCDAILREGRYEFRKPQPLPLGIKPDAKIHYLDISYRSDGAFVSLYE